MMHDATTKKTTHDVQTIRENAGALQLPNSFILVHIPGQRVRFIPKPSRPRRFALKGKTLFEFRDIPVDCGILDVFPEVSPGCHLTVMSNQGVS